MGAERGGGEEKVWAVPNNLASRGCKESGGRDLFSLSLSSGVISSAERKVETFT